MQVTPYSTRGDRSLALPLSSLLATNGGGEEPRGHLWVLVRVSVHLERWVCACEEPSGREPSGKSDPPLQRTCC